MIYLFKYELLKSSARLLNAKPMYRNLITLIYFINKNKYSKGQAKLYIMYLEIGYVRTL